MESKLFNWFKDERNLGHEVNTYRWKVKAQLLFEEIYPEKGI